MLLRIAFPLFLALGSVKMSHGSTPGTVRVMAKDLIEGGDMMLRGQLCKILQIEVIPDKEIFFIGQGVFTGSTFHDSLEPTDYVEVPEVTRKEFKVVSLDYSSVNLEDKDGAAKNISLEGPLRNRIEKLLEEGHELVVTVVSALDMENVVTFRIGSL
ncbi:Eukaryotic translation initiation factor 5A-1 [Halotydeus destructor]|nr:Eukaryotic translation initiation factor 5A-1 [Halotydeus destructor]